MTNSISYHPSLISRLKDPKYAALYLEAFFEEENPEPELLPALLNNVAEALAEINMTPEEAKIHQEKLTELLSQSGSEAIYKLGIWLQDLGLKLTVTTLKESNAKLITTDKNSKRTLLQYQ